MHLSLKSVKSIAAALFGCALLALPVAAHATQTVESLYLNGTSPVTGHTYSSLCTGLAWNPNPTTDIVCIESIAQAVSDASSYLASGDLVNIYFPTGTVDISWETKYNSTGGHGTNYSANGYIDVTGVRPAFAGGYQGELRVAGSGSGSTLITDNSLTTIYGKNLADVKFVSFTFTRSVATTSQGVVTSTGLNTAGQITFNVPNSSFLTPLQLYQNAIYDHGGTEANTEYIRAYTNSATAPVIVNVADNTQIAWGARTTTCPQTLDSFGYCAPHLNGDGTWTIYFDNGSAGTKAPSDAYTGNFVGMKMEGPAQAYYFYDNSYPTGDSVGFDHVTWQDMSRGVWDNITNAFVTNSSIVPRAALGGQAFCLSVPTTSPPAILATTPSPSSMTAIPSSAPARPSSTPPSPVPSPAM